jgi:hypothetical protein
MGLFAGIAEANPTLGGVYFQPGKYIVEVRAAKTIKSQKEKSKDYFVVETEIIASDHTAQAAGLRVGSKPSQAIDMGNLMAMPNIKGFIAAASGVRPDAGDALNPELIGVWQGLTGVVMTIEQICERAVAADNPLAGVRLFVEAVETKTKAGDPFTKIMWAPLPQEGTAEWSKVLGYFE